MKVRPNAIDVLLFLLTLSALFLWATSLQHVSLQQMNDLGLISVLSPKIIAAMGIVVLSFTLTLQRRELRTPVLAFQLACLLIMCYVTPNLIEEAVRFNPVYQHAGYTDYIMQHGTVAPTLDIYFDWPGFFALNAFLTKAAGYDTILSYAAWAPLLYNVLYLGPMYVILTSMTDNKRLAWLSLLLFQLTNWIGQDYFSPQGLNFFLYLVVIMILVRWFRRALPKTVAQGQPASLRQKGLAWLATPDALSPSLTSWQKRGLLCCLVLVYGLIVCSHPLTPFFTLVSVIALVLFRRCSPYWLPILLIAMTAAWMLTMARPYLSVRIDKLLLSLAENIPTSVSSGKLTESPLYQIVAKIRLYTTFLLWILAALGAFKRFRQGKHDITFILLALAGFSLIGGPQYGSEMLLRIYLFTQPFMCFFAASLFFNHASQVVGTTLTASASTHVTPSNAEHRRGKPALLRKLSLVKMDQVVGTTLTASVGDLSPVSQTPSLAASSSMSTNNLKKIVISADKSAGGRRKRDTYNGLMLLVNMLFLATFFFTRFGDEHVDYVSYNEWNAVQYLYQVAPAHASIVEAWNDAPLYFKDYNKYTITQLTYTDPQAVIQTDAQSVIRLFEADHNDHAYLFFSQEEQAHATAWNGLPEDALQRLATNLLQTGRFKLIYSNADAQILQFISKTG